ncbi:hypothetical protein [Carp edema virus]|nr:hypothetical protein [Carp edema virus]
MIELETIDQCTTITIIDGHGSLEIAGEIVHVYIRLNITLDYERESARCKMCYCDKNGHLLPRTPIVQKIIIDGNELENVSIADITSSSFGFFPKNSHERILAIYSKKDLYENSAMNRREFQTLFIKELGCVDLMKKAHNKASLFHMAK